MHGCGRMKERLQSSNKKKKRITKGELHSSTENKKFSLQTKKGKGTTALHTGKLLRDMPYFHDF